MKSPDFNHFETYSFRVFDPEKRELYKGLMNSKAWFKTVENSTIWEFIPENSRVLEKDFSPFKLKLNQTEIEKNSLSLFLAAADSPGENGSEELDNTLLLKLEQLLKERKEKMPANSYTTHLFSKGEDKILKKLGEETIEVILAKESIDETIYESADLLYHLLVHLVNKEIPFKSVLGELAGRMDKK